MTSIPQSPYARALAGRLRQLHPSLQQYFAAIPRDHVGIGEGSFTRVGTPRRWLWPLLRPFERRGVLFAGWAENVPFRVTNHTIASRAIAEREFRLPDGTWTMKDAVALTRHGQVVDELGEPSIAAARFELEVLSDGALRMTSQRIGLRWGARRVRVPKLFAPVVRVVESFDDTRQRQRIDLTIDMPLVGRIYEYAGDFTYRIERES